MNIGNLTIDVLVDTGALSIAFLEADLKGINQMVHHTIPKEVPTTKFQTIVAEKQLETPNATTSMQFKMGDIKFLERFIVMVDLVNFLTRLFFTA